MGKKLEIGCARPTGNFVGEDIQKVDEELIEKEKEEKMIKVGHKAPDFTAPAYHKGDFINVKLSDYLGKWVVLCFYPPDFTFV